MSHVQDGRTGPQCCVENEARDSLQNQVVSGESVPFYDPIILNHTTFNQEFHFNRMNITSIHGLIWSGMVEWANRKVI